MAENLNLKSAEKQNLVFTRTFVAPVEEVWKAWYDPEYIKQWWGPDGFTCTLAKINFKEGKTSHVCMNSPASGDLYSIWRYRTIIPLKQLEYVHSLADKNGNEIEPSTIGMPADFPMHMDHVVIFEYLGNNRTKLTLTEFDWPVGEMMEMSKAGMEQCLDKMAKAIQHQAVSKV